MIPPFIALLIAFTLLGFTTPVHASTGAEDRAFTVQTLTRIAGPVLEAMSENKLHALMPQHAWEQSRTQYRITEAFARTLAGIAPWLALEADDTPEGQLRARYIALAQRSLIHATDPQSADFCDFDPKGSQPLVEAAFLAEALLRAPRQLWEPLTEEQKNNVILALKRTRAIKPPLCNWVIFASMVETAIWQLTGECDLQRLETGVDLLMQWYLGDGTYGDGPEWHWDYYNSYVMQPMLLEVLAQCQKKRHKSGSLYPKALARAQRFAAVQERMISPEGTYPIIGRSSVYRFGAFRHLSYMSLLNQLPQERKPGSTRAALTAVIRRVAAAPGTLDENGWLQVGAVGHQPSIRDSYNNTGSLYFCLTGLMHLGLAPDAPFWTEPASPWTQQRIWSGEDVAADHSLKDE